MQPGPDGRSGASDAPQRPRRRRRLALRWLLRGLVATFTFAALYLLAIWVLGAIPVHRGWRPPTRGVEIMISSNGIHTDFYLPTKTAQQDWSTFAPLQHVSTRREVAPFVLIGWGDRGFFLDTPTWDDLSVGTALSAVFLPTPSVMHVYYRHWLPQADEQTVRLLLREEEYAQLVAYIERSFRRGDDGRPVMIRDRQYSSSDVFYEGVGSYHLFYTCNNWANGALDAAGVTTPLWSPFDGAIFAHLPKPGR